MTKEAAVRTAASALLAAIVAGRKAGLVITWPKTAEGLESMLISETAKSAKTAAAEAAEPKQK